ncbi:actinia tenebrosa protease inhibitors-like [Spodoptera frugiperda]|uniref:Actinia tenebrosa protease inhibitors-like n=1 Tax=Spodoptera frugiperda TaxID=7108 RepID=A0A9R0EJT3_SPOFR|nr:actinia tenebrosa protease inhibitors-like [Spodoptera frugiperda]
MFLGYIIHSLLTVISFTGLQLRANETSTDLTTESTIKITPIPEITVPTDLSTEATELTTEFTEPTFDAPEFTADATELTTDAAIEVENERASETFTSTQVQNRAVLMDDLTTFNDSVYCKWQPNSHSCGKGGTERKYYFDIQLNQCVRFLYAHCNHSYNMFDTKRQCMESCEDEYSHPVTNVTANVICRYQPDFGNCQFYNPMWYFDIVEMRCKGFSYSGCAGNENRFSTIEECLTVCGTAVIHD